MPAPETVAIPALAGLQAPPVDASLNTIVAPAHIVVAPLIPNGTALTVIAVCTVHPNPNE